MQYYIAAIMLALMPRLNNACKKPIILLSYTCLVYKALQHMLTKKSRMATSFLKQPNTSSSLKRKKPLSYPSNQET